jgi:ABC-type branched-subunit amino acid transport system permease subunit
MTKKIRKSSKQLSQVKDPAGFLQSLVQAGVKNRVSLIIVALALAIFGTMPFMIGVDSFFIYYLFMVFIYIVISQGWNLIGGYTGQISLGTHAFFALGGYTTALIWIH